MKRSTPHPPTVLFILTLGLFSSGQWVSAQETPAPSGKQLTVGLREAPPFAFREESGEWQGIAVDLWEEIANKANLEFRYETFSLADLLTNLEKGQVDAGVAALTISPEREAKFDFTQPFLQSGLAIAAEAQPAGWWQIIRRFLSVPFLKAAGALAAVILLFGFLVWFFERKKNEQFGGRASRGIGAGFWWSAVTMTTVGYGDKAPVTLGGRIVGFIWMFAAIIIISGFTAAIASSLTVGSLQSRIESADDLRSAKVGAIEASSGATFLEEKDIAYRSFDSVANLVKALAEGQCDAVVHDDSILRYELRQRDLDGFRILPNTLMPQSYAFGLPQDSPLRETINLALLEVVQGKNWTQTVRSYLGQ